MPPYEIEEDLSKKESVKGFALGELFAEIEQEKAVLEKRKCPEYTFWTPLFVNLKTREGMYWIIFLVFSFGTTGVLMSSISSFMAEAESANSIFYVAKHTAVAEGLISTTTEDNIP